MPAVIVGQTTADIDALGAARGSRAAPTAAKTSVTSADQSAASSTVTASTTRTGVS